MNYNEFKVFIETINEATPIDALNAKCVVYNPKQGANKDLITVNLVNILRYALESGELDTFWDDLRVPLTGTNKGTLRIPDFAQFLDDGSSSTGVFSYLFDKTADEELHFAVQVPHDWKIGTDLKAHVHWSPMVDGAADKVVSWGLEYSVVKIGAIFSDTIIAYGNTSLPNETLVAKTHYLTALGDIDMSSVDSVSSMIICRVFRDATGTGLTDDYDNDAALLEVDFHYQKDGIGSKEEYTK